MNRRQFVQVTATSALIPGVLFAAPGIDRSALVAAPAIVARRGGPVWDYVFFDDRFAAAQRWARQLVFTVDTIAAVDTVDAVDTVAAVDRIEPIPVQGDVTGIWTNGLAQASRAAPLSLQGVTTESFHFCLRILLGDYARVGTRSQRLDRDLHAWSIRTVAHSHTDTL